MREFTELAFAQVGRKLVWEGTAEKEVGIDATTVEDLVSVDKRYFRPTEVEELWVMPAKLTESGLASGNVFRRACC